MESLALDPAWIALIGTLCGGIGLKVAEHWLGRNQVKVNDATQMRNELRTEIQSQKDEIKQLEAAVEKWRAEYYDLRDEYVKLQTELAFAIRNIKVEAAEAEKKVDPPSEPPTP